MGFSGVLGLVSEAEGGGSILKQQGNSNPSPSRFSELTKTSSLNLFQPSYLTPSPPSSHRPSFPFSSLLNQSFPHLTSHFPPLHRYFQPPSRTTAPSRLTHSIFPLSPTFPLCHIPSYSSSKHPRRNDESRPYDNC